MNIVFETADGLSVTMHQPDSIALPKWIAREYINAPMVLSNTNLPLTKVRIYDLVWQPQCGVHHTDVHAIYRERV